MESVFFCLYAVLELIDFVEHVYIYICEQPQGRCEIYSKSFKLIDIVEDVYASPSVQWQPANIGKLLENCTICHPLSSRTIYIYNLQSSSFRLRP